MLLKLEHRDAGAEGSGASLAELTRIATKHGTAIYGAGKYCTGREATRRPAATSARLEDVLADANRELRRSSSTHGRAGTRSRVPMRKDYQRFVELINEGAKDMGFANTGEVWRSGYDMTAGRVRRPRPTACGARSSRCTTSCSATRSTKLVEKYGATRAKSDGMIPAHLTGNLWQQDWSNLWPIAAALPGRRQPRHHRRPAAAARQRIFAELLADDRKANGATVG